MDNKRELYKRLGVPFGATTEQLKEAYRRLVKAYHPDITKDRRDGERLAGIVHAYKVLSVYNQKKSVIDFPVRNPAQPSPAAGTKGPNGSVDMFALGKILVTGKTVGMRAFAARALGNSGRKSAYAFLRKGLYDKDPLVVKSVIESIGKLHITQCAGELGATFSRGGKEIQLAVLTAIEQIGCKHQFKCIVLNGLRENDHEVRRCALRLYVVFKKEKEAKAL